MKTLEFFKTGSLTVLIVLTLIACDKHGLNVAEFSWKQRKLLRSVLVKNDSIFNLDQSRDLASNYLQYVQILKEESSMQSLRDSRFYYSDELCEDLKSESIISRRLYLSTKDGIRKERWVYYTHFQSNFFQYLTKISEKHKSIRKYLNSLEALGGPKKEGTKNLLDQLTLHELEDPNVRLILAIHFFAAVL